MDNNFTKLRENSFDSELPPGLFDKVMLRIEREEKISAVKRRLAGFSVIFIAALAISLPLWLDLFTELNQSGFIQYLMLPFYDLRAVAVSWQDFSLSLLETLPMIILTFSLSGLFVLLFSLRLMAKYFQIFKNLTKSQFNDQQYGY